jgi:acetoin utilization protein AcuC
MLLVYGPRSTDYDFGPDHPLTPRRFGPSIELLRSVGAVPGLAPEPAPDDELLWCHTPAYIATVRRFSADPFGPGTAGIGTGDDPPFAGMHDAGAMVAGGSLRAVEAILRGDEEHAFHPGGGLHHAMPDRASGFCIYDDPALAIARARRDGLRVLYVDLDVHHGDGVQAIHGADPGVLTVSIHETGRYLFPGTGDASEIGEGGAAGTVVNVPFEPFTGADPWLHAVRTVLPELAAAFGPDLIVTQHGADSHAWDPLAHLRLTTTAMSDAARVVDDLAHRYAGGRWLATGGGGYDAYRVVPRMWSLVWLAGSHRDVPERTPEAWRERWSEEAARYRQAPLPETFLDAPNAGLAVDGNQSMAEAMSREMVEAVRRVLVPRLLREARDRGWWDPLGDGGAAGGSAASEARPTTAAPVAALAGIAPTILAALDAAAWSRLTLADRVLAPFAPSEAHALVAAALAAGACVSAAVVGSVVVGAAVVAEDGALLGLGVAPGHRRAGLGGALLRVSSATSAEITVAERDPVEPASHQERMDVARRLLASAGFAVVPAGATVRSIDPKALTATRRPVEVES